MESHDDEEKRNHHTDLIRSVLEEQFQQASEIRVVRDPETRAEVFYVDLEESPSEYRLRVVFTVLVASRRDGEIAGKVAEAAAMMRDHPRWVVILGRGLSLSIGTF